MAANPVSRPFQLQIRHIAFAAQIIHLEELKQNDTSFNRTAVKSNSKFEQNYIKYAVDTFIPNVKVYTRGNVINNYFYNWGHRFIYDFEMLRITLSAAGFSEIVQCEPKTSQDPHLCGLEKHGTLIGDEFNKYETIVVEARKL